MRAASHSGIARQRSGNLGYKYSKQAMQFCEIKMAFGRLGIDAVPLLSRCYCFDRLVPRRCYSVRKSTFYEHFLHEPLYFY